MRSTRVATSFTPADDGRLVAQTWLGSRTILFIVAVVGMTGYHRTFSQVTGNWDVQHFMSIARNGYADPLEMAFFPGLPALLKVGSLIGLPMEVTGVLLGLVGSALAAWALFRIGGTVPACLWLHRRRVHRVPVLRRRILVLGACPSREMVASRVACRTGVRLPSVGALPRRCPGRDGSPW